MKYFDVNLQLRLASNFSHSYKMQKQKKKRIIYEIFTI